MPESFKVLVKELQSLGLNVEVLNENEEEIHFAEDAAAYPLPTSAGSTWPGSRTDPDRRSLTLPVRGSRHARRTPDATVS